MGEGREVAKAVSSDKEKKKMWLFSPKFGRLIALSGLMNSVGLIGLHHL